MQSEIKLWIEGIDFFKKLVSDHLENVDLLQTLKLDFITRNWCQENEKLYPLDFLDEFKSKLQEAYDNNALNLPISLEKVNQFKNTQKRLLNQL